MGGAGVEVRWSNDSLSNKSPQSVDTGKEQLGLTVSLSTRTTAETLFFSDMGTNCTSESILGH